MSRPRDTHVLLVGVKAENRESHHDAIESGLKGMHMGWRPAISMVSDFDAACVIVPARRDLRLVYILNEVELPQAVLQGGSRALAELLAAHPFKPWVTLDRKVANLGNIFQARGFHIMHGPIEYLLHSRWVEEGRQETKAA